MLHKFFDTFQSGKKCVVLSHPFVELEVLCFLGVCRIRKRIPQFWGHDAVRLEEHHGVARPHPPADPVFGQGKFSDKLISMRQEFDQVVKLEHLPCIIVEDVDFSGMDNTADLSDSVNLRSKVLYTALQQLRGLIEQLFPIFLVRGLSSPIIYPGLNETKPLRFAEIQDLQES